MRYEARQGNNGQAWWWSVFQAGVTELCPPPLTEAEAKIIAFALNAVADGHQLRMMHRDARDFGSMARLDQIYDGPTHGVAPEET